VPALSAGDRVLHTSFGMARCRHEWLGRQGHRDVDFGSVGLKRLALRYAPIEKL
jgi:DNA helicase-2/ATP-dependent DNA helicase PcrA